MAIVKKAAAITNAKFGDLENRIAKAIIKAADEVILVNWMNIFHLYGKQVQGHKPT